VQKWMYADKFSRVERCQHDHPSGPVRWSRVSFYKTIDLDGTISHLIRKFPHEVRHVLVRSTGMRSDPAIDHQTRVLLIVRPEVPGVVSQWHRSSKYF